MKQLQEDLWQSALYSSGILNTHAYFLKRPDGNILFYNTGNNGDLREMEELGGIKYQLLTHRDEAAPSLVRIRDRFGSKLGCSVLEVPAVSRHAQADIAFEPKDQHLGDIEIIHTPGHTDGSICFFYKSPHGKSYLFTGDTLFQWDGKWATFVIPNFGGSKASLANSLLQLRGLHPDIVMSSGFIGPVPFAEVTEDEWVQAIDDNVARLKQES